MAENMKRTFSDRDELAAYLREQFPEAASVDGHISPTRGGRAAAVERLQKLGYGRDYEASRNYLDGPSSRLSAYIRHGVLSLAEVRDFAIEKEKLPEDAEKFINELAWRDYWQRLYADLGEGIWKDLEPYKTGKIADEYANKLPPDIVDADTGLPCIDALIKQLYTTGYLHNHARMWLAAYVVHWRRIKWQVGARWFLSHLLDGDPASNNLSWQWVASTFSAKPYVFNRENVEKFSEGEWCKTCPFYGRCDFEGSYERLERKLFPDVEPTRERDSTKRRTFHRGKGGRR
ncbi:MAG: deoxyribodipyrimidine photo-lyase [Anaerolineae bacterium]|nr:deoxyribodipyrimidine photo-lyase [Chloroflexota bacterium]MBP6297919.1 deoxyribodipyrimidine photo-lyase [Anaerolineae bacterium]